MRCVEHINPAILRWARTTAGLSEEEAARKIGLGSSAKATAVEKLAALEDGRNFPTHGQLSRIAIAYRRPRAVFYRSAPPLPADGKEGFRTLVEHSVPRGDAALLAALIRDIRARQDMVRSIIEDDEDVEPRSFIGSASITDAVPGVAGRLRKLLGFDEDEEIFRGTGSPNDLFSRLRERVEDIGVFVILAGNLGSFHSNIDERVFRGFAIADPIAPFIVINDRDAKSAWSFTLIHELTHIFVGSSGVSFPPNASMSRKGIEKF